MTSDARSMSIIDAADPLRLASFWTALPGTGIGTELGGSWADGEGRVLPVHLADAR
jgi:hypothetical protein